jgi:large subunit ribosomal protein L18
MARGKVRIIAHRRRRQGRTDYRHRLGLLKSGRPRLVIRKSLNSMTCQIVVHSPGGDRSVATATSRHLDGFGWSGPRGNLPCAYLTGLLCGTLARKEGVKSAVLDSGLHPSTRGSRIYSALKGALDSGLDIPHSPDILPPEERLRGSHIDRYAESQGRKSGMSKRFDMVRVNILEGRPAKAPSKPAGKPAKKVPKKPARNRGKAGTGKK